MTPEDKKAYVRQMREADRLRDVYELAAWRSRIDGITLAKYLHTGAKVIDKDGVDKVRNIIRGDEDAPFPNAPCYLDGIQRGL